MHNVLNSLACIAVCHYYGLEKEDIKNGLSKFTGAHRRFEYVGSFNNIQIYDDYGHHPTEIEAVAKALNNIKYNQSWIIFQPHTYSRTKLLLNDFADALSNFDNVILLDIYAAREKNNLEISSNDLANKMKEIGKDALYIPDFDKAINYIKENIENNDIIITLGAGTVTNIGPMILKNSF